MCEFSESHWDNNGQWFGGEAPALGAYAGALDNLKAFFMLMFILQLIDNIHECVYGTVLAMWVLERLY
jgi:hypothetical protein